MFDPDKARLILEAVMLGMEPDRAALAFGITADEHARWISLGSADVEGSTALDTQETALVAEYVRALDQAIAQAELTALREIRAGTNAADANKWFLERRFPDKWAKTPAAVRAEQLKTDTQAEPADPHVVVDEDEVARMRREREEKRRARGGNE
ncbi:hypothetical protein [Microbacterium sp. KNMS]